MENLGDLKKLIDDSIEKVSSIPPVIVGSFSTQKLKKEITPLLENAKSRINDLEIINANITGIRNEIIEPVKETIKEKSKWSNWLAWIGIGSGLISITLALYSFYSSEIQLSDSTLNNLKKINVELADEQVKLTVKEIFRLNENLKYEQNILLTYRTKEGKKSLEKYYDYLIKIGYKNVNKFSFESIDSNYRNYNPYTNSRYDFNITPYIYYRMPNIDSDILKGIEQNSKYYHSNEFGRIIGVMHYKQSHARYIEFTFNTYSDIDLLIVL